MVILTYEEAYNKVFVVPPCPNHFTIAFSFTFGDLCFKIIL